MPGATSAAAARWRRACVAVGAGALLVAGPSAAASQFPAFPPNIPVTPEVKDGYQQPSMAADPTDPSNLAIAYQDGHSLATCYLARSSDHGATWTTEPLAGEDAEVKLPEGAFCWNPILAFGADGTLYYAFQTGFYFGNGDRRVLLTSSPDGGETFTDPVQPITGPEGNQFWPALAVDQASGRVYVGLNRTVVAANGAGPVAVASSDDGGRTFSSAVQPDLSHVMSLGSLMAVGPDGRLYIAYLDQGTNAFGSFPEYIVGVSDDEGRSFQVVSLGTSVGGCLGLGDGFDRLHADGPCRLIVLGTGPAPGQAYAAWWDERGPEARARNVLSATADGGATWTEPAIVAVPTGAENDHQHRPWLAVSPGGDVHLAFHNRQGEDQDGPQDVYLATSGDGGATFDEPRRLNDISSDSRLGSTGRAPGGFTGQGDFIAAVPSAGGVGVAWTDMRRSDPESGKQDIYFASTGALAAPAPGPSAPDPLAGAPTATAAGHRQLPATGGSPALGLVGLAAALLAIGCRRAASTR